MLDALAFGVEVKVSRTTEQYQWRHRRAESESQDDQQHREQIHRDIREDQGDDKTCTCEPAQNAERDHHQGGPPESRSQDHLVYQDCLQVVRTFP
ncbi:hypothetical protein [Allobranchiibius huperziae]|uniref:Uncharacterized protein n=1 Tax=Allobranchiibius huperziae TaxID=1874116 RepID=A0A853DDA8_9MICO|nr:hypothetical protein [Allobranchiibius huperziae]NYJ73084.1 hypothetical protein [Allobranchiibius huperziae]